MILGIKEKDMLDKNKIKIIDGIAGAGKSSALHDFLYKNNVDYVRTTSTNQLKKDAEERYNIKCYTTCSCLFQNENRQFYTKMKEPSFSCVVLDEVLQTNKKVFEWCEIYRGKVNIIITCDSKQLLSPEQEKEIKEAFNNLKNNNNVIYVNIEETKRPRTEKTREYFNKFFNLADEEIIYSSNYLLNNFKYINYEDMEFNTENIYITHTKEIEEYIYINKQLAKRTDIERIPKAYLASKEPKDLMNYSLLSQLRAEKTKALKYTQAKNVACPHRFQGSEVVQGQKLYYIIEKQSKISSRELYTVITRLHDIEDLIIVLINFTHTEKLEEFKGLPIKQEKIPYIDIPERETIFLPSEKYNLLFNSLFKDDEKYTYKMDYIAFKSNKFKAAFAPQNKALPDHEKITNIKTICKKDSTLSFSYVNKIYKILENTELEKITRVIYHNDNEKDGMYQVDIAGAYPTIMAFDDMPTDGEISYIYNENNLNYYIYNGEKLKDNSIITENLKNYVEEHNLGKCTFVFSLPKQKGSKAGKDVFNKYHKNKETKEKYKTNMKWGILERPLLKLNKKEDAYIINESNIYEIYIATVYSHLTYYMLKINEEIQGNYIQVDAVYFDNLENNTIEKIKNILPDFVEFRIIKNENKEVIFKNYEELKTEKEEKREREKQRRLNMTEEQKEKERERQREKQRKKREEKRATV